MESIVRFVNQPEPELDDGLHWDASCEGNKKIDRATSATTMAPKPMILGVPRRPFMDVFGYGMANAMLKIGGGRGKAASSPKKNYRLFSGAVWPNKAYKVPRAAAALPATHRLVIKNMW